MVVSDPLRPNATVSDDGWTGDHTDIDNAVTQPATNTDDYIHASAVGGQDTDVIVLGFPNTLTDIGEATSITVWAYNKYADLGACRFDVNLGGWQEYKYNDASGAHPTVLWGKAIWNGSWTQSDVDGLQVRIIADVGTGKADEIWNYIVYCVITYTAPSGYGHDFMGVPAANIGSVSGVSTTNIASIKGV